MKLLIVGCGYLGRRAGRLLRQRGVQVFGTTRSGDAGRREELAAWGIEPIQADVLRPESLQTLPEADLAFYCVGYDRSSGASAREVSVEGLRRTVARLAGRVRKLVYASSTGIYGQDDGGWVDERSPTEPRHESGRVVLEAERALEAAASAPGLPVVIVRFAGLYGPGRIVRRANLLQGKPIPGDPQKVLNLIHIDDAARAAVAALDRGQAGRVYLAGDDRPVTRLEYYGRLAELLGVAPPRFEPPAPGSPEALRDQTHKRVSNRRLRVELGVDLAYSDIATGLPAALDAERSDPVEPHRPGRA